MKIYLVGGAVRDRLLGREARERDYVAVGATPEEMAARGLRPVGSDFPVFIDPRTGDEYALARTERKVGRGYRGFVFHAAPEVTLEEDLARRDLTINAVALDERSGEMIDPFDGRGDLRRKRLRHVSPAFAEDPLRVLRAARFAAMLPDFSLDQATAELMRQIVAAGEIEHLARERIWRELQTGFGEPAPRRMIEALSDAGALARILPEVEELKGVPQNPATHPEGDCFVHTNLVVAAAAARMEASMKPIRAEAERAAVQMEASMEPIRAAAKRMEASMEPIRAAAERMEANMKPIRTAAEREARARIVFAALLHDIGKGRTPRAQWPSHRGHEERGAAMAAAVCARLGTPRAYATAATTAARWHGAVHNLHRADGETAAALLTATGALRDGGARLEELLAATAADADFNDPSPGLREHPNAELLRRVLRAYAAVDAAKIAATSPRAEVSERIRRARIEAAQNALARADSGA